MSDTIQLNPYPLYNQNYETIQNTNNSSQYIGGPVNQIYPTMNPWNKTPNKIQNGLYEEDNYITYGNTNNMFIHNRVNNPISQKLGFDSTFEFDGLVSENNFGNGLAEADGFQRLNHKLKRNKNIPVVAYFNKYTGHYEPNPQYWLPTF